MPSVIQEKFYGSVKVFWLNKELLEKRIKQAVKSLAQHRPEVERIILFGSYVEDKFTVFSDIDVLIVVNHSDKRFIERAQDFRDYFKDINIGLDLFVYTNKEINSDNPWFNQILTKGRCVYLKHSP